MFFCCSCYAYIAKFEALIKDFIIENLEHYTLKYVGKMANIIRIFKSYFCILLFDS